jgi:hypothetical protein
VRGGAPLLVVTTSVLLYARTCHQQEETCGAAAPDVDRCAPMRHAKPQSLCMSA